MTAPHPAPPDGDGLVHLGVVYDDVDDLVARCLPEIRTVLDAGGDVHVTVDRRGVRRFRDALGADADRIAFPAPRDAFGVSTPELLRTIRGWTRPGRRTLVLGQYSRDNPPGWDCAFAEDAVNLVLADLPLTVLCACETSGSADHRELVSRAHTQLVGGVGRVPNPHFRPPAASCPAPLAPWGDPQLAMTVHGGEDLAEVRHRVTAVAERAGLSGPSLGTAVLAVHEAVLLAGRAGLGEVPDPPMGAQELRVRTAAGAIVTEVLAPDATEPEDGPPDGDLRQTCLPSFCDHLSVHDGPHGRLVRVLTSI